MPIYLDDDPMPCDGASLGAALLAAQGRLEGSGRILMEVKVDGRLLLGQELDSNRENSIAAAEVRLYSADPREIAESALETIRERLGEARSAQLEAADLFQRDDFQGAMKRLGQAMEVWNQTPQATLKAAMILGLDVKDLRIDGRPVDELTVELVKQLEGIRDLVIAKDTVGLADALAYEWPKHIDSWNNLVQQLLTRISSDPAY